MSITVLKNDSLINYFSDDTVATGQIQLTDPMQLLADPNFLRNALLTYSEKVVELEHKVEVMQPTMEAFDRIATAEGSMCLTDAAKALQQEPQKFNKWLHMNDWIYKRHSSKHWVAYQEKIKAGYLEHKVKDIQLPDGTIKITEQVRVTPKGLTKLSKLLGNNNA
ncbi:phage antirepressor KilAC domain-containing protein [Acinetobacter baumannii]|nr:phage antirepressor KilAC domain-containing protein [Acinetobacter baumannii]